MHVISTVNSIQIVVPYSRMPVVKIKVIRLVEKQIIYPPSYIGTSNNPLPPQLESHPKMFPRAIAKLVHA